jgi:hypothetical protein
MGKKSREERRAARKGRYTAIIVQYLGSDEWRVGHVPKEGKTEWVVGLPLSEALLEVQRGSQRVVRVDPEETHGA